MTLDALIMLIGALVAVIPFLGFPNTWDSALLLTAGIIIILLGIIVRRRGSRSARPHHPRAFESATAEVVGNDGEI